MSLDILNAFLAEGDRASLLGNQLEGLSRHINRPMRQPPHRQKSPKVEKPVTNVSYKYTPQQAIAAGLWWASVAPKGHMVCAHRSKRTALHYVTHVLRGAGCTVKPIEALL